MCGAIEPDEYFLWNCPVKQYVWNKMAYCFLDQSSLLFFDPTSRLFQTTAKTLSHWKLDLFQVITCEILSLWELHWKCTFEDSPFGQMK
jgi:hypothetical protein